MKKYYLIISSIFVMIFATACVDAVMDITGLSGLVGSTGVNKVGEIAPNNLASIYEIVPLPDTSKLKDGERVTRVEGDALEEQVAYNLVKISNKARRRYSSVSFPGVEANQVFVSTFFIFDEDDTDMTSNTILFLFNGGYLEYFPKHNNFKIYDTNGKELVYEWTNVFGAIPADIPKSIPFYNAMSYNKMSYFQDGKKVYFFLNDHYFASATVSSGKKRAPTIALQAGNYNYEIKGTLLGYFASTDKLAVADMKTLSDRIAYNTFNYNEYFDIKLSGGVNTNKTDNYVGTSSVFEGRIAHETVDFTATITPRANAPIPYPAVITVDCALVTVEQRKGKFLISGNKQETYSVRKMIEKDFVIENSSQTITISDSLAYMESYKASDMSEDVGMYLIEDPKLTVDVVQIFAKPK
jgi:hypothetical protein